MNFLLKLAASGKDVPFIRERPSLLPGLDFYKTAFRALCHDRPVGIGVGSIPWSSIDRYAERKGLDADQAETLERYIRGMEYGLNKFQEANKEKEPRK